jgi:uncharacterized protein (DUF1800 family)
MQDGLDVLRVLARQPATARHLATKLVRHFVADDPPPELVDEIADVFLETDGDLREVTRTLFTSERFYDPANYQSKVKRPFEYVASVLRVTEGALDVRDRDLRQQRAGLVGALQTLHHVPYHEIAPTGFPTTSDEWVSAGAMIFRMNLALDLANGRVQGVRLDPWSLLETATAAEVRSVVPQPAALSTELRAAVSHDVTRQVLFGRSTDALRAVIQEDLARSEGLGANALVARALGLALGSPAFQRY